MKKNRKAIILLVNAFLLVAIIFSITVASQVMKKGYATIAGHSMFRVVTGSMEPTLSVGSLLISKETKIEDVSVGDIICFRAKEEAIYGETITHRVISKIYGQDGTLYLETRGDANMVSDGHLVSADNLIGEIIWYSGNNNIISKSAAVITTGQGFFTFVLMPIAVIAVFIMRDSVKSINQELHTMKQELARQEIARETENKKEQPYTEEEYIALEERLRREILEELLKNAEMEDAGNIHGQ